MGRDRDPGVKRGGMAGLRRKKGGKAGFENPYCGPSWMCYQKEKFLGKLEYSTMVLELK